MQPEIMQGLFGIGGAIVGASVTAYFTKRSKDLRELVALITPPVKLIEVSETIEHQVEILIGGKKVQTVYMSDIQISNTGNKAVHDANIEFRIKGSSEIISFHTIENSSLRETPSILQTGKKTLVIKNSYLNPDEEIRVRVVMSNKPAELTASFRQPDVRFKTKIDQSGELQGALTRAMFEAISHNFLLHLYMMQVAPPYRSYVTAKKRKRTLI